VKKARRKPPQLNSGCYLIDTHCHLDMKQYENDLEDVISRAVNRNVISILTIGIDESSSRKAVKLAFRFDSVFAAVGVHPHEADNLGHSTLEKIGCLVDDNRSLVLGYGEIGLDYFKCYSSPENQRKQFRNQLALAKELGLPIIIHDRDAHEDTLSILKQESPFDSGGVMHCFSGNYAFAEKILDLGLHISIPGIVTFKKSTELQEVARMIPLSSLLLETDGPFLAPEPWRGKRNEPSYVAYTAEKVAGLRNMDINELARITTRNSIELFHLPLDLR